MTLSFDPWPNKKPLKAVWPDCKAATYTEKTKAENMYVTLKLEMFTVSVRNTSCKRKKQGKVNISVCSLKREVKVKVTKFCIGPEELINGNNLTKFDLGIINGLWETKLNATAKRKLLTLDRRRDRRMDGETDDFHQFIDWTCFPIRSKIDRDHPIIIGNICVKLD